MIIVRDKHHSVIRHAARIVTLFVFSAIAGFAQNDSSGGVTLPKGEALHLGVSYYPEFWGEEKWEEDFDHMKEIGVNTLRIGEFAWGNFEPREDHFTTEWLDRFLTTSARHGFQVMLCTPTATPPKWLSINYPDTRVVTPGGAIVDTYNRKHYCPNSPTYRKRTAIILKALAAVAARHPNVVSWQIDNEMGPHEAGRCFDATCRKGFVDWVRRNYVSTDALNQAWRTNQWSQQINDWNELSAPANRTQPTVSLAHARWTQESWTKYYDFQRDTLRQLGVTVPITTNIMVPIYEGLDYWDFAKHLDFIAVDHYIAGCAPPASSLAFDICRSLKNGPFWLSETGTRGEVVKGWDSSEVRLWAWKSVAMGARGLIYFRWRTSLSGNEDNHPALRTHSDQPTAAYGIVRNTWREMQEFFTKNGGSLALPKPEVAVVFDWMSLLAKGNPTVYMTDEMKQIERELLAVYSHLQRCGLNADIVSPTHDLAGYKLVIAPGGGAGLDVPGFSARLQSFVNTGGVLLGSAGLIAKDPQNIYYSEPRPRGQTGLFGCRVGEWREINPWWKSEWSVDRIETCEVEASNGRLEQIKGLVESLQVADSSKALLTYHSGYAAGQGTVVESKAGSGRAFYCGVSLDQAPGTNAMDAALAASGIQLMNLPAGVERVICGNVTFYFNHTRQPVTFTAGSQDGSMLVGPYGVKIITN